MKRTVMRGLLALASGVLAFGFAVGEGSQVQGSPEDEEAIKKVIVGTTEAFNEHGATAFTRFYTPDAELVTIRGERMRGAAEIEQGLAAIFETRAKEATLKTLAMTIRFIRPDVAVAHVTNEMSGLVSAEGEKLPAHRELSIRVFVKENGVWHVTAFYNTRLSVSEAPARHR